MRNLLIGVHILEATVPATLQAIAQAEAAGVDVAWLTMGGSQPDPVAIFAVAATRTERIKLGTCIVPTYPRHPLALAQEARVVAELAPGRFRLGVGPSHQVFIEGLWGIPFRRPLSHLREYLQILKAALQQGRQIGFSGEFFNVRGTWGPPVEIEIMASALRRKSFELAGELADGAISWVCPFHYVQQVAIPALATGAARARRPRPRMVMHIGVSVHEDATEAQEAGMRQLSFYPQLPFYRRMFQDAGFPEAAQGTMSPAMLESIFIHGNEATVSERLRRIADSEVDEVICTVVPAGLDREASARRTLTLLGELSRNQG